MKAFGIDPNAREKTSDYECVREIKRIGQCKNPGKPDDDLNNDCKDFINQIDYGFCAGLHLNDADFAGNEWYLYVGYLSNDIWNDDNDTILLLDSAGRVVDSISY